jgi:hypothetical protein
MQGSLAFLLIRTPLNSQRKQHGFLLCANTPLCGVASWNGSSRTVGCRMALLPRPTEVRVQTRCRVRDYAAEDLRRGEDREVGFMRRAKMRLYKKTELPIVTHCPLDRLRNHLADPILSGGMRFGLQNTPPGGPTEWNQTPFAHQHMLYQKLLSFWTGGVEYRKGDFVDMRGGGWQVTHIDGLEYRPASDEELKTLDDDVPGEGRGFCDDLIPRLWLKLRRTTPGRHFHQSRKSDLKAPTYHTRTALSSEPEE